MVKQQRYVRDVSTNGGSLPQNRGQSYCRLRVPSTRTDLVLLFAVP